MATTKAKNYRDKEDKELSFDIEKLQKELFEIRFKSSSEGIAHPSRIGQIKKEIAKMKTVLSERKHKIRGQQPK